MDLLFEPVPRAVPSHKQTTENIQRVIFFLGVIHYVLFHPHHFMFHVSLVVFSAIKKYNTLSKAIQETQVTR